MAYRQYIGARYVPLYDGTWNSTKEYEPLTIVDDANGNSYTSRKTVPAGTPLSDREFWAPTGNFSGALRNLSQRVDTAEANVSAISDRVDGTVTDIGNLQTKTQELEEEIGAISPTARKILFVTDSYGTPTNNFIKYAIENVGLEVGSYEILAQNSTGFIGSTGSASDKWENVLSNATITIGAENITDIIILGGANDWNTTMSALYSAIQSFMDVAKTKCPKARVHLGMLGFSKLANARQAIKNVVLPIYKQIEDFGGVYLENSEYVLKNQGYMQDDYHPNDQGHKVMARALSNYLMGGIFTKTVSIYSNVPITDLTGKNHSQLPNVESYQMGNTVRMRINGVLRGVDNTQYVELSKTTAVELFRLDPSPLMSSRYYSRLAYLYYDTGSSQLYIPTILSINNGVVAIQTMFAYESFTAVNIQFLNEFIEFDAMET